MRTFQDLQEHMKSDAELINFVHQCINEHKSSPEYLAAYNAQRYFDKRNSTILAYQKLLYTISGEAVPDNYSANYKLCSGFYETFTTQEIQYLLGNGVTLGETDKEDALGEDFDDKVQEWAREARIGGVAFGFWNLDHIDIFKLTEFMPLYDEEDGALKAGIRFWQIDSDKPLRATLYELDGYTQYMWSRKTASQGTILQKKRAYKNIVKSTKADGDIIYKGENYPNFPIVPMYGNDSHISTLTGLREQIDCYDLIKSGFANDIDDASQIYWIIQNAGGMDDIDLVKFVERMKTVRAAVVEDGGAHAESHTMEVPYASREAILTRLENDLYRDAMALDVKSIASGAATATQIKAAYEPLNEKADGIEFQVTSALKAIFELAGIDDTVSYSRSIIINKSEEVTVVLSCAEYLPEDYITEKLLTILGDADRLDEILEMKEEAEMDMLPVGSEEEEEEEMEDTDEADFMSDFETDEEDDGSADIQALADRIEKLLGGL